MSKNLIGAAALVFSVMFAVTASAQQQEERRAKPELREEGGRTLTPEQFKERKERVLQMLTDRQKRIEQERACVEASKDMEAMLKCRPEPRHPVRRHPGGPQGPGPERRPTGGGGGPS